MRVHALYHVPFEEVGSMADYFSRRGDRLSVSRLYQEVRLPEPDAFDLLIVMGGPMGVHDEARFPWLTREKRFLETVAASGKLLLGICLGAQLLAHVAGANVTRNRHREIGWFPVTRDAAVQTTVLRDCLPPVFDAFHWHGDTFELPPGARPLGTSQACPHQGFVIGDRVVGLQFHLETTPHTAAKLIENCRAELDGSRFVQDPAAMLVRPRRFQRINAVMERVLNGLIGENIPA